MIKNCKFLISILLGVIGFICCVVALANLVGAWGTLLFVGIDILFIAGIYSEKIS
jgi:uncharacterized membrane protein HdeD (DUF308 family)